MQPRAPRWGLAGRKKPSPRATPLQVQGKRYAFVLSTLHADRLRRRGPHAPFPVCYREPLEGRFYGLRRRASSGRTADDRGAPIAPGDDRYPYTRARKVRWTRRIDADLTAPREPASPAPGGKEKAAKGPPDSKRYPPRSYSFKA